MSMKKTTLIALAALPLVLNAQNKIDFPGRLVVDHARQIEINGGSGDFAPLSAPLKEYYDVTVELDDENFDFNDDSIEIVATLANMAIIRVTPKQMEAVAALPQVRSVSLGYDLKPTMYIARPATGVNAVQEGTDGLDGNKYNGKGIVCGLFDTGLDVNHVNFKDADGNLRTKRVWVYKSSNPTTYQTPTQIGGFTTENSSETHGTHVLGIMAGGYNGPANYAVIKDNKASVTLQTDAGSQVPFYGIATESDLAVCCGTLAQAYVQAGVQNIVNYAKSQNMPCVVNLSLGDNLGPHDGTSTFSKWMAELGKDAIICIAAGNEGEDNISITTTGEQIKTFVTNTSTAAGYIEFWGSDSDLFTASFIAFDRGQGRIVYQYDIDKNLAGGSVTLSGINGINGNVKISSNIDPSNNRYNVSATFNMNNISSVLPGFIITPKANQTVDGFANNLIFASNSQPGYLDGSPANSINGLACGDNVLVIGSFTTAANWAALGNNNKGTVYTYSNKPAVGAISSFSSYGYTFQGRKLPDVCAPGEAIISSYSNYYVNTVGYPENQLCGIYKGSGMLSRNSPWGYMQGTSMASPFAAGVVATWLEANPDLTIDDVKDIISNTSNKPLGNANKWGAGKINALAGIKKVLSGVSDITADPSESFVISEDGRNFDITVAGAKRISAQLYSLAGVCVARTDAADCNVILSAEGVVPGIYVLRIDTDKSTESRKITVR